jgi:SAM-dependent methyltransferase
MGFSPRICPIVDFCRSVVHEPSTKRKPEREHDCRPRYDRIGAAYARTRQQDPRLMDRIAAALGTARTVVNVGAGAGSYEPRDRYVIAIEPTDVMAAQRPRELAPAVRATAGALPLRDGSVDAAMAVLSVHHWDHEQERGVRELRRVARGPVVILTCASSPSTMPACGCLSTCRPEGGRD